MQTFIVAYVSAFDNVMCIEKKEAESSAQAMLSYLKEHGWDISDIPENDEEVMRFAFDNDAVIGAMEA